MNYLEYNEKKQHGSLAFPIQYYYIDNNNPKYIMTLHWHSELEIIHIISGNFCLYLDNKKYNMSASDVAIVECSVLHRGDPTNCIYECIVFDINMLRKHHNDYISKYLLPIANHTVSMQNFYNKSSNKELITITEKLFTEIKHKEDFYEFKIFSILYELFFYIFDNNKIIQYHPNNHNNIQLQTIMKLIDWIQDNFTERITLSELSDISNMNEKYLCKFFKEYTSKTPIDFINNLRIQNACHEIDQNKLSITEAALESGFNDLSYFSKTFKKYIGISPKEYKNKCLST